MKKQFFILLALLALTALAGCGGSGSGKAEYNDGSYEGTSSIHEGDEEGNGDGYGVVNITIKDNVITEASFLTYMTDGTLKDEEYGKQNGEVANTDFYNKAQRAVLASQKYGEELARYGDISQVDAISGASISYEEFKEAVADALDKAKK